MARHPQRKHTGLSISTKSFGHKLTEKRETLWDFDAILERHLAKKKERADEPLHAEKVKGEEPVTRFKAKLNKYGFIHVPKKALLSLPFEAEEPLTARIEGQALVIRKA